MELGFPIRFTFCSVNYSHHINAKADSFNLKYFHENTDLSVKYTGNTFVFLLLRIRHKMMLLVRHTDLLITTLQT